MNNSLNIKKLIFDEENFSVWIVFSFNVYRVVIFHYPYNVKLRCRL